MHIVLHIDTVFEIIFETNCIFCGFILTGQCKISPSPSPYCPYLPITLLPLFLNTSHISCLPCSPSHQSPSFPLFCTVFVFFILSTIRIFMSTTALYEIVPSVLFIIPSFHTVSEIPQMSACIFRSLLRASPCTLFLRILFVHAAYSAIFSYYPSRYSFRLLKPIQFLFYILLPENGLVLIFLGKETISISYLTSWILFHY